MFGRATTVDGKVDRLDAGVAHVRDKVAPMLDTIPGCLGISAWVNRETGRSVVLSAWQDEASMIASAERVKPLREEAAAILGGDARAETFELAGMHQVGPDQTGMVTRMITMSGDPAVTDTGIALFHDKVVPAVSKLPGFNTISLAVNRRTGRSVISATYANREAAIASREAAAAIRSATSAELGLTVDEVEEMELVHVGIRGPDDVPQQRSTIELPTEQRA